MIQAGMPGKRSLLKNFILRNNLMPSDKNNEEETNFDQLSSIESIHSIESQNGKAYDQKED